MNSNRNEKIGEKILKLHFDVVANILQKVFQSNFRFELNFRMKMF